MATGSLSEMGRCLAVHEHVTIGASILALLELDSASGMTLIKRGDTNFITVDSSTSLVFLPAREYPSFIPSRSSDINLSMGFLDLLPRFLFRNSFIFAGFSTIDWISSAIVVDAPGMTPLCRSPLKAIDSMSSASSSSFSALFFSSRRCLADTWSLSTVFCQLKLAG